MSEGRNLINHGLLVHGFRPETESLGREGGRETSTNLELVGWLKLVRMDPLWRMRCAPRVCWRCASSSERARCR